MSDIFVPDIFSTAAITYKEPSSEANTLIPKILSKYDFVKGIDILKIEQLGSLELNSNNFKIETSQGVFLLKRVGIGSLKETLESQYRCSDYLRSHGVPLPTVLPNRENKFVTSHSDEKNWVLTKFIPGGYFAGRCDELLDIGRELGKMLRISQTYTDANLPVTSSVSNPRFFQESLTRLFETQNSWSHFFPQEDLKLLENHASLLQSIGFELLEKISAISLLPSGICHIDLHPHNILAGGGKVAAFVDIDSFQVAVRATSIGFTTFKLVRQRAVHEGWTKAEKDEIAQAAKDFLRNVFDAFPITESEQHLLETCALYEIFRRVLIISDLNIQNKTSQWNKVLKMHLAALEEIPIIFSGFFH